MKESERWVGWLGRQTANGVALFLAIKLMRWWGVVVIVDWCK